MNLAHNKYLADRASTEDGSRDRWTLVVSSDPALLASLHCASDDHFIALKPEASLSEWLHEAALI